VKTEITNRLFGFTLKSLFDFGGSQKRSNQEWEQAQNADNEGRRA